MSSSQEQPVVSWQVYAGESLRDASLEPITVLLDEDAVEDLHCGDPDVWRVLLMVIEMDLHSHA